MKLEWDRRTILPYLTWVDENFPEFCDYAEESSDFKETALLDYIRYLRSIECKQKENPAPPQTEFTPPTEEELLRLFGM